MTLDSRDQLKDWEKGDLITATRLTAMNQVGRRQIVAEPPLTATYTPDAIFLSADVEKEWWLGEIQPKSDLAGGSDYTDARYVVAKQHCLNSDASITDALRFTEQTVPMYGDSDLRTVTNLPELDDGTHILRDGQEVLVMEITDASIQTKFRCVMSEYPFPCWQSDYNPGGSDMWVGKSDVTCVSDLTGDPGDSDLQWITGWNYIDSDGSVNPWMVVDFKKTNLTFAVIVKSDGGYAGNKSDACTFTYTVEDLWGENELGTTMTPDKPRPQTGELRAGGGRAGLPQSDFGTGFYLDGVFHLYDASESLATSDCG